MKTWFQYSTKRSVSSPGRSSGLPNCTPRSTYISEQGPQGPVGPACQKFSDRGSRTIRPSEAADGIDVRELPGGRCVSLMHRGPYDQMGRSYAVVLSYVHDRGYRAVMPTREVYHKGPGMIFRGNPKNYLTEIQVLVEGGETRPGATA